MENAKENLKNKKGITLIALVITIIVLLILAGVSIAMLTGENGILSQAQNASEQSNKASEEEKVRLAAEAALIKNNGESILQDNLEEELESYFNSSDFSVEPKTVSGEEGFIVTVTETVKEGRKYFVSSKGAIKDYEEQPVSEPTDVYAALYTDGSLVFSSEEITGSDVSESWNITNEVFMPEMSSSQYSVNIPWLEASATSEEEFMNTVMQKATAIKKVIIKDKIVPTNTSYWFTYLTNVTEIEGLENLDTGNVTDMSYMFSYSGLTSLDLSGLDTSNVTNMSFMFSGCSGLISLNLSSLDARNVTDMSYMFSYCSGLTSLNLSGFDTRNVTDMSVMFYNCSSLTSLDLSSFNTSNVTDMSMMFDGCSKLESVNLSSFNTSKVEDMTQMFYRCSSLKSLDISNFDISSDTDVTNMLKYLSCPVYIKDKGVKEVLESDSSALRNFTGTIEVK